MPWYVRDRCPLADFFIDHDSSREPQLQDIIVGIASLLSVVSHHCGIMLGEISWQRGIMVSSSLISWYRPPRPPQISNPPSHFLPSGTPLCSWVRAGFVGRSSTDTYSPLLTECNAKHGFDLVDNPVTIQCNPIQFSSIQCNAEHWLTIRLIFYAAAATALSRILDHLSSQSDPAQLRDHCSNLNCTLPYMHSYTELHSYGPKLHTQLLTATSYMLQPQL